MVTETDKKVENMILKTLKQKYPTHKFIAEESSSGSNILTNDPTWIIDPIDGTANYIHGFPFSAISIGLAINKEIVIGVVYNFLLDQLYAAKKGSGSFLNGKPIHVSQCKELRKAIVITDLGYTRTEKELTPKISTIRGLAAEPSHVHGIRTLGCASASCCMVSQGGADAYIEYGLHCWDYAAGELIVREAGGVSLYPTGGPLDLMGRGVLLASSKELAEAMLPYIQHVEYPRD